MYHHKSGSQKRKEKRGREHEDEKIKNKKPLLQYFKKSNTGSQDAREDRMDAGKVIGPIVSTSLNNVQEEPVSCSENCILPSCDISLPTTEIEENASCNMSAVNNDTLMEEYRSCSLSSINASEDFLSEAFESHEGLSGVNWKDPALWPDTLRGKSREYIVLAGLMSEQDLLKTVQSLPKDCDGQAFSEFHLYSKSPNGREKILRDWLRWSDSKKVLYCTTCLAFSTDSANKTGSSLCRKEGYDPLKSKWHKLYKKLPEHEHSAQHRKNYWSWRCLQKSVGGQGVDHDIQRTLAVEAEKFTVLLERLLDVTLFLASRNLAFRGSSQRVGDIQNGNFLGILELIAHYDAVLKEHLDKVKRSQEKGKKLPAHYLSWGTQNEFINLCGRHVLNAILSERQEAIYFTVICDASPDISHTEQNVIVLRYVHRCSQTGKWCIQERFLEFFDFFQKTGEEIAEMLTSRLREHNIDLKDCRGQGYDNGANMAGRIKGVKSRILEKYPQAIFCPCAAHSLNLVDVHAASSCPEVKTFFGSVNRLYVLFSNSPERWHTLTEEIAGSLHGLSDTRWSSRVEAIRPVAKKLPSILQALEKIISSRRLTSDAQSEAVGLYNYFSSFRAILLATFWLKVLQCFDERNKILQARSVSMEIGAANIRALAEEMKSLREKWPALLSEARLVADGMEIPAELMNTQQIRRKKSQTPGQLEDPEAVFKVNVFLVTLDTIISDLDQRFKSMEEICNLFAPILKLRKLKNEDLEASTKLLVAKYPQDLTDSLLDELQHLRKVYNETFEGSLGQLELLNCIYDLQLEGIFGQVCVALRIFITLPLSVAEGERAFSKLSLIKNYLRSTMSEQRLNSLAMLSIEHELANHLDFKELIKDFASSKVRRL
ncbi:zinc finger MYM-type protein 1-like [Xenopus laevis]|uniref:Zinc finger MYM-type protein 1-like n=1 Tax=Xenopus laevis TaxID=8355 RepID=A0A8J1LXM1_XENLA|nr:zinc finger MYM-type protein 1-like [Xenopus laevis]